MNDGIKEVRASSLNYDDFTNYLQFIAVSIVKTADPPTDRHLYHLNRFNAQRRQVIEQILVLLRQTNARLLPIFESCVNHIHLVIEMVSFTPQDSTVPPPPSICDVTGDSIHHARKCVFKNGTGVQEEKNHSSIIQTYTIRSDFVNMIRWWHVYVHFGTFLQVKLFHFFKNITRWNNCVVEHIPETLYNELWETLQFLHTQNQSLLQPLHTTVGYLTCNQDVCL